MKRVIALILVALSVIVITPAMARGELRAYIEGKVEGRAEWFHWDTLGTSKPELKLELRGTKSQGNIVKYEWDFGDGSTAEGEYVTHTYYSGNWNITLTVYDKKSLSASETLKIEVRGGKPQKKAEEKPAESDQEKSLWEKKWSQKPAPEYTKHRVDDPEKYNVQGLRVNADFKVDLGEWWSNVELGTYWVPAAMLGTPDTTKEELLELKGQPEKAKREIDVLFEALAYAHLCFEPATGNVKTQGKQGIRWGFPMPAKLAIREEKANCAAMANIVCYLLEDDYDEVGFFWRHSSFDGKHVGGHCTSYIKENGEYYFFDAASLTEERSHYPVEDGDGHFYHADMCDLIIQSTPKKCAIFWAQVSRDDEAIFAMFSSPDNSHFALGRKGHNLYYPKAFDESNLKIWKDPEDSVELLEASYNPTPPENYADYMPYKNYGKLDKTEKQGEPEIATIPSDG